MKWRSWQITIFAWKDFWKPTVVKLYRCWLAPPWSDTRFSVEKKEPVRLVGSAAPTCRRRSVGWATCFWWGNQETQRLHRRASRPFPLPRETSSSFWQKGKTTVFGAAISKDVVVGSLSRISPRSCQSWRPHRGRSGFRFHRNCHSLLTERLRRQQNCCHFHLWAENLPGNLMRSSFLKAKSWKSLSKVTLSPRSWCFPEIPRSLDGCQQNVWVRN